MVLFFFIKIFVGRISYSDLAKLIRLSSGTLTLYQDYKYNSGSDSAYKNGITISKTMTIDGNGHTIDGSSTATIFNVAADNVIIKNFKFN